MADVSLTGSIIALLGASADVTGLIAGMDGRQSAFDADGARTANGWRDGPERASGGTPLRIVPASPAWRPVTDAQMRVRCNGCAPPGYRFHRSVEVDVDHDGRLDRVEMVTDGGRDALRVTYSGRRSGGALIMRSS